MNSVWSRLFQLEAAKASSHGVIRDRHFHGARLPRNRGIEGTGIEAIVDRDIAGKRVEDTFLGLDRQHHAPAGHVLGPLDGVHPDIGAAVDGDDAIAVTAAAQIEHLQHQIDFDRIVEPVFEKLQADPAAHIGLLHQLIEAIDDQGAVVGRGGDERELARQLRHGWWGARHRTLKLRVANQRRRDAQQFPQLQSMARRQNAP